MKGQLFKKVCVFFTGIFLILSLIPLKIVYAGIRRGEDSLIKQANDQRINNQRINNQRINNERINNERINNERINNEENSAALLETPLAKAFLTESTFLSIDSTNQYDGMQKSFQEGYSPTVKDGIVYLTIPIISSKTLLNDELSGRIIFETGEYTPFQKINYQKTVRKQLYTFNQEIEAYVFKYELPLLSGYKNGQYIIYLETSGELEDGQSFTQKFTLYVSITDGVAEVTDTNTEDTQNRGTTEGEDDTKDSSDSPDENGEQGNSEDSGEYDTSIDDSNALDSGYTGNDSAYGNGGSTNETTEEVKHQPRVMLDSYEIENGAVQAGEAFAVSLTFKNTNKNFTVYNAKVSLECETTDIIFDKNSFYIEKVDSEQTFTLTLTGSVAKECALKNAKIVFTISYEDKDAVAILETESMILRIKQPVNVQAQTLNIPDTVYASETIPVSIQVMNLGRGQVSNVRLEITAPGLSPIGTLFIGNIDPGMAMEGEVKVFIETLNEGSEKYGESRGTYTLYYEDEYGEEYSESFDFSTTIKEPEVIAAAVPKEESETVGQWWISALVVVGLLGLAAGIPLVRVVLKKWRLTHAKE